jgi:hypothetical protein
MVLLMAEVMIDECGRPYAGGEVETLLSFLDHERATLERKCRGLSDEHLRMVRRPSSMTLGGLLKHLACVHMIEEYARHNGHADLMRESIDGQTG